MMPLWRCPEESGNLEDKSVKDCLDVKTVNVSSLLIRKNLVECSGTYFFQTQFL